MLPPIHLSTTFQSFWYPPSREKETTSKAHLEKTQEIPVTQCMHGSQTFRNTEKKNQLFIQFMPRPEPGPLVSRVQPVGSCGRRYREGGEAKG